MIYKKNFTDIYKIFILQEKSTTKSFEVKKKKKLNNKYPTIVVLVISCNRVTIQRCLDQLIKLRPNVENFPIIVSQDCIHQPTTNIIEKYGKRIFYIKVKNYLLKNLKKILKKGSYLLKITFCLISVS